LIIALLSRCFIVSRQTPLDKEEPATYAKGEETRREVKTPAAIAARSSSSLIDPAALQILKMHKQGKKLDPRMLMVLQMQMKRLHQAEAAAKAKLAADQAETLRLQEEGEQRIADEIAAQRAAAAADAAMFARESFMAQPGAGTFPRGVAPRPGWMNAGLRPSMNSSSTGLRPSMSVAGLRPLSSGLQPTRPWSNPDGMGTSGRLFQEQGLRPSQSVVGRTYRSDLSGPLPGQTTFSP